MFFVVGTFDVVCCGCLMFIVLDIFGVYCF